MDDLIIKSPKSLVSLEENDKVSFSQETASFHSAMETLISGSLHDDSSNMSVRALQIADLLERTAYQLKRRSSKYQDYDDKQQKRKRRKYRIPARVTENIFVITVIWQLLCVFALELVDALDRKLEKNNPVVYVSGIAVMVVFQISNLILALAVSIKLTKQYMHHTATMKFLLQSYFSTLFLFGGLYTFIGRIRPHWFANLQGKHSSRVYALEIFSQLLFTSISTGTLCGAAPVTAIHPVTEIMMGIQMMLSFVYFASILSQVINPSLSPPKKDDKNSSTNKKGKSSERKRIRDYLNPCCDEVSIRKNTYGTIVDQNIV